MVSGVKRTLRDQAPSNRSLTIESFSKVQKVLKSSSGYFESSVFEAFGFNWSLVLYPNGNEKDDGKDHISLYLKLVQTDSLLKNWEVLADFKLFVHEQIKNKYLMIQDGAVKIFSELKSEHGFAQLLPLSTFNNSNNGYLVNDTCTFGVEISVIRSESNVSETLTLITNPIGGKFTWNISDFSELDSSVICSPHFVVGDREWQIQVYPNGNLDGKDNSLSVFIHGLAHLPNVAEASTYAEVKLRLLSERKGSDYHHGIVHWFPLHPTPGRGLNKFISLEVLRDKSEGFLVKDALVIEAEFQVISKTTVNV